MRPSITAVLLLACLPFTQLRITAAAQTTQPSWLTIPAQTVVPLTLVNPIKNESTKPGDQVRAVVAFPVTVGDQLAIPAGTYVQGTLLPPAPKVKHQSGPGTQIHFTRLVFANGYAIPLDATQAELAPPSLFDPIPSSSVGKAVFTFMGYAGGQTGTLPPLHNPGPNPALIVGPVLGVVAAIIVIGIFGHHKADSSDFIVHDAGWQFQMKLTSPVTLDPSLAGAASLK